MGELYHVATAAFLVGTGMHRITEDFAKTIAQTVLSAVLASAGPIVGALLGRNK